jgi:predicted secreted protein
VKAAVEETGEKVKDAVEETVERVETHRVRSFLIVLLIAALTIGVWYFLSERD